MPSHSGAPRCGQRLSMACTDSPIRKRPIERLRSLTMCALPQWMSLAWQTRVFSAIGRSPNSGRVGGGKPRNALVDLEGILAHHLLAPGGRDMQGFRIVIVP